MDLSRLFINRPVLPRIFIDKPVNSAAHNYYKIIKLPIICNKYNMSIETHLKK